MTDTETMNEPETRRQTQPFVPLQPFYDRDGITIYNGDCRQVLPFLDRFDLLLTDPPYGIGEAKANNPSRSVLARSRDYGRADWDDAPPAPWLMTMLASEFDRMILWGGNYYGLPGSSCWLVWDKDNGANDFADCELAWTNLPKAVRKFRWRWQGMLQEKAGDKKEVRVHPTQKPLALMKWCLGLVPDAKSVLDPFMGSGTTLVAAKQLGLRAVGIEINADYCAAAVERLRQNVFDFRED